ncbi:Hcp family type VI secretion system effector [Pseudomonadota bacterium]
MKPKYAALLIIAGFLVFAPSYEAQAVQMFLQLSPLQGESRDHAHRNWMDVLSFDMGLKNPSASSFGTTRTAGKAQFGGLVLTKNLDKASVLLALAVSEARRFPKAIFEVQKPGGESPLMLRITLEDVTVTSIQSGGSGGEDKPIETIELTYGRITRQYFPRNPDGSAATPIQSSWDVRTNQRFK